MGSELHNPNVTESQMVDTTHKIYEEDFFRWFATWLRDKGLQFSRCGFKLGKGLGSRHEIDLATGFWKEPAYSASKPPRWLFQIETEGGVTCAVNPGKGAVNIGAINASQEDKAGVVFRLMPLIREGTNDYRNEDDFEVHAIFVFHGATPHGSSSEPFSFDPNSGEMRFKGNTLPYIASGLLGLCPGGTEVQINSYGEPRTITYGEVINSLALEITSAPMEGTPGPMPIFDLSQVDEFNRLKQTIGDAWAAAGPVKPPAVTVQADADEGSDDEGTVASETLEIPENTDLYGIDPAVYRQINALLKSGKQHIMLYGPPGTGKTTLARWIAATLTGGRWTLITGSSDWSSQDIIGGYQPVGGGSVAFIPGVLLRNFDQPLIIDELNRCDIDKVLGPLFTVLSGQQTTLPYRLNFENAESLQYVILPESKPSAGAHEFAPGPDWRLIATINSIDKAALYQMSYALTRRFGWVYVDAPRNAVDFIATYLRKIDPEWVRPAADAACPLAKFWGAVNVVRTLGPAPIIDTIKAIQATQPDAEFFASPSTEMQETLLDTVDMVFLPMLDGILNQDAQTLTDAAVEAFSLNASQAQRIKARMASVAV